LNISVARLENLLFGHRSIVLAALAAFTLVMAGFGVQLRMDAGFEKQLPTGHEYIRTFLQYRHELFNANRLTVVVRARHGTIWTKPGLQRVFDVTQAVQTLPNVDPVGVQSLWTSNTYVNEITEEGFRADPLIPATITPDRLSQNEIEGIARSASAAGFVGSLVSRDQSGAMITAEINEVDKDGKRIDYIAYNHLLEKMIRHPFEDGQYSIEIIGFAKQIGDIADGASSVLRFCSIALALTAAAVFWYSRSVRFTVLPILCSLTSLVWQFGALYLLGFGLDPLGVLVPFLVFAIGVSHGVQQISFIIRELAHGKTPMQAARSSFSGLLVPGVLALVTAFVSFITLLLVPIPMIRELAIAASLGVGFKIVTNLIMLPAAASFVRPRPGYAQAAMRRHARRARLVGWIARVAEPRVAVLVVALSAALLGVSAWESRDRVVGTLQPGAAELRPDSRFNLDAVSIAANFDVGLDWLSVVIEAPPDSCANPAIGTYVAGLTAATRHLPGVVAASSYSTMLQSYNEGYNEGLPKTAVVPIDPVNYGGLTEEIRRVRGYVNADCSMTALHLYLTSHQAVVLTDTINVIKAYATAHEEPGITVRLAGGNAGVTAAVNDEVSRSETPMLLYVYGAIMALVFIAYRDVRAMIVCCAPLTVGTFIGYWFMEATGIGLTVATLPVMVLAVGIGVDYAFYIYNRLQLHLAAGLPIVPALQRAIQEVGMATIFTAITLAVGVATWAFSPLKFQADMGKLLAFMFMINLVMALTTLPALAVVLDRVFPRRHAVRMIGALLHD
jgi:predicted RND superfamily exporter protein